jgi:hypothetical protein
MRPLAEQRALTAQSAALHSRALSLAKVRRIGKRSGGLFSRRKSSGLRSGLRAGGSAGWRRPPRARRAFAAPSGWRGCPRRRCRRGAAWGRTGAQARDPGREGIAVDRACQHEGRDHAAMVRAPAIVVVFRSWSSGGRRESRCMPSPFGLRPRLRARLVAAQGLRRVRRENDPVDRLLILRSGDADQPMNTSRPGSRSIWPTNQSCRRRGPSGRPCRSPGRSFCALYLSVACRREAGEAAGGWEPACALGDQARV